MANQYTKRAEQQQAIEARLARQEAAGIPNSTPPIADPDQPRESRLAGCHLNGIPVEQLPAELVAHLRFEITDEGLLIAEREYQAKLAAGQVSLIEMESDEAAERKRFGQMKEDLLDGASIEEADNPMQDLMDAHLKPGQRGRWMDPEVCGALGMRGYQPVLDADGQKVTCGQSFLGYIPEDFARARERKRDARNAYKLSLVQQQVQEQVGQLSHAQKSAGLPEGATGAPVPAGLRIESREIESPPGMQRG